MIHDNPNGGFHSKPSFELGLIPATRKLLQRVGLHSNPRLYQTPTGSILKVIK